MRKDKLVRGFVVAGGSDPGQRALLRNPHDSLFFSVPHFFCNSARFFLLEGSEDQFFNPGEIKT